jgi:hypothetical protein
VTTFVALGDSITFGVGDPVGLAGARAWRGWAALADRLPVPRPARRGGPAGRARPDPEPSSPPPTRLAEIGWLATKGTAWVLRRSTDLVPGLPALAIRERWSVSAATMDSVAAGPDAQPVR